MQECLTKIQRHEESDMLASECHVEKRVFASKNENEGKGLSGRLLEIQSRASGVGIAGIRERPRQSKAN